MLIFPQGVHARPEQELAGDPAVRFRPGVALLARRWTRPSSRSAWPAPRRSIPAHLDEYTGPTIGGIPVSLTRGPLAIAFGPPLTLKPGEAPAEFAARLQAICFDLTRQAEKAIGA